MSVQTPAADDVEIVTQINENDLNNARYTLKTTEENKTKTARMNLTESDRQDVREQMVKSPRWRSDSQILVDAIVFYLDGGNIGGISAEKVIEGSHWTSESFLQAAITPTLFEEIEMMVSHNHTPWNTKQEFYVCAVKAYNMAGFPAVTQR